MTKIRRPTQHPATHRIDKLLCFLCSSQFLPGETWREIEWSDSEYLVSDTGRVLSLYNNEARILQPYDCNGYLCVAINGRDRKIHRLVAQAFIPNPEGKKIVHHKDGNKHNNHVSNLSWATHSENRNAYLDSLRKPGEDNGQKE